MSQRPLNVGLIGGGGKAFIVNQHNRAVHFDGTRRITCGALHEDPVKAMEYADSWPYPITGYPDYKTMIAEELKKPVGKRMDYVLIVTPNFCHFEQAMACLEAGFPVLCEKPVTMTCAEAGTLASKVNASGIPFGVAHTYIDHWSSWLGRWIVVSGLLGEVRRVNVQYQQGWLANRTEDMGVQQAEWRVDPKRAGGSGCGGDIGTHAFMQARFLTDMEVVKVLYARLTSFVQGRKLDDNFTTVCQMENGAEALICASQVMTGHDNNFIAEVSGTLGSLSWSQPDCEKLVIRRNDMPDLVYKRGKVKPNDGFLRELPACLLEEQGKAPADHTEGFHDAFARIHRCFEADVRNWLENGEDYETHAGALYAGINDGVKHMQFLAAAIQCAKSGAPVALPI